MATYTIDIKAICAGGEHIKVDIKKDGQKIKTDIMTKTDIMNKSLNWEEVLPFLINQVIKQSGATTLVQAKVAVEAASWVI